MVYSRQLFLSQVGTWKSQQRKREISHEAQQICGKYLRGLYRLD
jgi:hypothetical protein